MPTPSRGNLVFARVGDRSLHRHWLNDASRDWDLQISFFGSDRRGAEDGDLPLSEDRGTKWDSIFRYLTAHPDVLDDYDYLAFLDDDLEIQPGQLNRLFHTCREFDLYVAQPGLTHRSFFSHPITLRCPAFRLRYTNYIEGMAPCFKASYLKQILPDLAGWYSGWGIARAWALLMREPERRAAVIDEAAITHTRALSTGTIYKDLEQLNINPHHELARVSATYDGVPSMMAIYGGYLRHVGQVNGMVARIVNGLSLVAGAPRLQVRKYAMLSGMRMVVRAFTQRHYRPVQLQRRSSSARPLTASSLAFR